MPAADVRLLVLDGGGVRGLSSLMILRRLMAVVDPDAPPRPCDYFDMIGGTSTGGLIAIMLGRLRMTIDECIDAYTTLSDRVFEKKSHRVDIIKGRLQGRFDSTALELAVKNILAGRGLGEDALLKDIDSHCKVFVCATSKQTGNTVCLASYRSLRSDNSDLLDATTIWQACRATCAATTFFEPIAIGPFEEEFIDGALGENNPVYSLWNQAQDAFGGELRDRLRCLVSIGTGVPALKPVRDDVAGIWATLKDLATETEKTAQQFHRDKSYLDDEGRYYRFNVNRGLDEIGLEESRKKKEIAAATRSYIESQAVFKQMKACADNIAGRGYFGPYRTVLARHGAPGSNHIGVVPVSHRFVGRQETIGQLHNVLNSASAEKRTRIAILYGLGGQGKTQVAAKYANDHRSEYQLILWVDGSSALTAERSFARFANVLGCGNSMRPAAAVSAVLGILTDVGQHARWLLVFDNLDDPEPSYMQQVASWIPDAPLGHVILTTRIVTWDLSSRVSELVEIPALSLDEAVELLSKWVPPRSNRGYDEEEAIRIVKRLGFMALLINQAGAFISKALNGAMAEYLAYYNDACKELLSYGPQYAAEWDYQKHVELKRPQPASAFATLKISFDYLLRTRQPIVAELLTLLAFLDRDNITIDLLCRGSASKSRHNYEGIEERTDPLGSGVPAWLVKLVSTGSPNRDAQIRRINLLMINLEEHYFLQRSPGPEDDISHRKLRMHPVVQDWLRVRAPRDEQVKAAMGAILLIDHAIDDSLQFLVLHESNTALLPHVAFAVPVLTELLSDPDLQGKPEHGLLLRAARRFGSLFRAHNQYEHAESLLGLVWKHQTQRLDVRSLGEAFAKVDSIMSSKADKAMTGFPPAARGLLQSVDIHDLAPLVHSMAISRYHQGKNQDALTLSSFLFRHQNSEPARWRCLCAAETLRHLSMIYQARWERSISYQYARDAYAGFLSQPGRKHPRSLFAFFGYLSTCSNHDDPPPARFPFSHHSSVPVDMSETARAEWIFAQAGSVAEEFESFAGAQATMSRHARVGALGWWRPESFEAHARGLSKMLDTSIAAGLYSLDEAVPVLDEPTLRLLLAFGEFLCLWYRTRRDAATTGAAPPSRQWLADAAKYGTRAWRGYNMVMPFIAPSAGVLLCDAYILDGKLGEAKFWLKTTQDLVEEQGGDPRVLGLQRFATLLS